MAGGPVPQAARTAPSKASRKSTPGLALRRTDERRSMSGLSGLSLRRTDDRQTQRDSRVAADDAKDGDDDSDTKESPIIESKRALEDPPAVAIPVAAASSPPPEAAVAGPSVEAFAAVAEPALVNPTGDSFGRDCQLVVAAGDTLPVSAVAPIGSHALSIDVAPASASPRTPQSSGSPAASSSKSPATPVSPASRSASLVAMAPDAVVPPDAPLGEALSSMAVVSEPDFGAPRARPVFVELIASPYLRLRGSEPWLRRTADGEAVVSPRPTDEG